MTDIRICQMPSFKKAYKKLHQDQIAAVNNAIRAVVANPLIGEAKKGDLWGVFVYKFKANQHEYLLAYEWNPSERLLLALGVHENFYRDLKNKR